MNRISLRFSLLMVVTSLLLMSNKCEKEKTTSSVDVHTESAIIEMKFNGEYADMWRKVDSLQRIGLFRSALEVVQVIDKRAEADKHIPEQVKALIHILKFKSYFEEDEQVQAIGEMEQRIARAEAPLKQILHSITAQLYWGYFQNNQWKFLSRTTTENFEQTDIRTWDLTKLAHEVRSHFLASLSDKDDLVRISMDDFKGMVVNAEVKATLRPTLYDFLAHEALDFFETATFMLHRPIDGFESNDARHFLGNEEFSRLKITTPDSLSTIFYAFEIHRDLAQFHAATTAPEAAIHLNLRRLEFVRRNSIHPEKEQFYLASLNELAKLYPTNALTADVRYAIAKFFKERGDTYSADQTEYQMDTKRAFELCAETIRQFPGSYGSSWCEVLKNEILRKEISVRMDKAVLPGGSNKVQIDYRNIDSVYFRIARIDWDYLLQQDKWGMDLIEELIKLPVARSWSLKLKDFDDYQSHSVLTHLPESEPGHYLVLVSPRKDFRPESNAVAYATYTATELSVLTKDIGRNAKGYTVLHRSSGQPIKGAQIQIYERYYDYGGRSYKFKKAEKLTTDAEGQAELKASKQYRSVYAHVSLGKDEFSDASQHYLSSHYEPKTVARFTTHLFTDRKIYRPGQKIYFKGILLKSEGDRHEIQPNATGKVEFYDANYQKVGEKEYRTNEFGSFAGEFEAPQGLMNGQMRIQDANRGAVYFSIEDYKRPKFEVKINPLEGAYKLGQEISVKGEAKNFAGSVVDAAKVTYRVTRNMRYPIWGRYFGNYYGQPDREIANGLTETNEKGEFTIQFPALPDAQANPKFHPIYNYTIQIDVTDITGETQSTSQQVAVAEHALNLDFRIGNMVNRKKTATFLLASTNLNGQKVGAKGTVTVHQLIEPDRLYKPEQAYKPDYIELSESDLKKKFPFDDFEEVRQIEKLKKGPQVFSIFFNTRVSDSLAIKELKNWKPGRYVLEVTCLDTFGVEVKDLKYFTVYDPALKTAPTNEFWWISPERIRCEPGEYAEFLLASADQNVRVWMEAEDKSGVFLKRAINLSNEQTLVQIPAKEHHRGNFTVRFSMVKQGVHYAQQYTVEVPRSDKMLEVAFSTFRNKLLPGQKEEWTVKITGKKGEQVAAELLAAMYDASLDQFAANSFYMPVFGLFYGGANWSSSSFGVNYAQVHQDYWNVYTSGMVRYLPKLNWYEYNLMYYSYYLNQYNYLEGDFDGVVSSRSKEKEDKAAAMMSAVRLDSKSAKIETISGNARFATDEEQTRQEGKKKNAEFDGDTRAKDKDGKSGSSSVQIRTNLNETAFFYPHLKTNEKGEVLISFTIPEALTRWKFISLAHTKDLKTGYLTEEVLTQKDLMVMPNPPRFMREGDKMTFAAKVSNLTEQTLKGAAKLELFDAQSMKPLNDQFKLRQPEVSFEAAAGQGAAVKWDVEVPFGVGAIVYRVTAISGSFSDGEENALPVLSNRMLVTESLPLPSKGIGTRVFKLEKLMNAGSSNTLRHHQLTLEYTSNPAWYAVQAMPYMMEYPYECAEQIFTRYYANALATSVANSNPKIKQVFEEWKHASPEAFLSNLEKNQELKALMLEETPWVLQAKNESERKKRVGLLFDLNRMSGELKTALRKLEKMQVSNGGWPWFPGMPENRYITQHIVTGMGHLDRLGVKDVRQDGSAWRMVKKAVDYLDQRVVEDLAWVKKYYPKTYLTEQHISQTQIQYLYARSFFKDLPVNEKVKEAQTYYLKQMQQYWLKFGIQTQAMIALAAHRYEIPNFPQKIMASLKERALIHDELGMYWKDNVVGYYWYQAPIETQALLIEAFDEVAQDLESVEEMKVWLLKQKQTTDWKTTKATAGAVYALLMRGTDLLANDEQVEIEVGGTRVDPAATGQKTEAGTGYFKKIWSADEVKPQFGEVKVTRKTKGVSWGALYWQYFEELDKITPHETPLKLQKQLFLVRLTPAGEVMTPVTAQTLLKPGDKIRVRIELRTDRDMEYVHLKDMRAAGFEPVNVFSNYKYQGGIGYYESTRDAATNFFIDYLRKGTYVFEYDLRAALAGDFSNGITTIQCMYAPEFTSHSAGIRVKIGEGN
jgi:uncharacterized protein YfaS (alpha-2-macroglobulin family)